MTGAPTPNSGPAGARVLIVDDEPGLREPLADYLSGQGFAVLQAQSAADLGRSFGATLTEAEVRWLMAREFACTAEDVVWRRSKLGLRMDAAAIAALDAFMAGVRAEALQAAG